jgi:hypothetical protein
MKRININKIDGLSGFKLSLLASSLQFDRPNTRGQHRPDKVKKAVLRALCDRYPNVWPGLRDIAAKASCSMAQARRVLRELEFKDRLITDISPTKGKKGGRGKNCTVQYFIMDRKIVNIVEQRKWFEENAPIDAETHSSEITRQVAKPTHARTETHSSESGNPLISASEQGLNPLMVSAEPVSSEPTKGTDKANAVRSQESGDGLLRLPNSPNPCKKRTREENIQAKIDEQDGTFVAYVEWSEKGNYGHPFDADTQKAFAVLQYKPDLNSRRLTRDFVSCAVDVYEEHCHKGIAPALLCTKIIDECRKRQKSEPNGCYFWPPDFQAHRDRLRAAESEQAVAANA